MLMEIQQRVLTADVNWAPCIFILQQNRKVKLSCSFRGLIINIQWAQLHLCSEMTFRLPSDVEIWTHPGVSDRSREADWRLLGAAVTTAAVCQRYALTVTANRERKQTKPDRCSSNRDVQRRTCQKASQSPLRVQSPPTDCPQGSKN